MRRVALQLRHVGEALQSEDEFAARLSQRASGGVDKIANYVHSADVRQLRNDAESFARTRPAVFFGGAFLLGMAVGRFFKSSNLPSNGAGIRGPGSSPALGSGPTDKGPNGGAP